MTTQESLELLKICDNETKKALHALQNVMDAMQDPDFKLRIIESKDLLKDYEQKIKTELTRIHDAEENDHKVEEMLTKIILDAKLLLGKNDSHIASLIFDDCNDVLKALYKAVNAHPYAEKSSVDLAVSLIQILIELREDLVNYL